LLLKAAWPEDYQRKAAASNKRVGQTDADFDINSPNASCARGRAGRGSSLRLVSAPARDEVLSKFTDRKVATRYPRIVAAATVGLDEPGLWFQLAGCAGVYDLPFANISIDRSGEHGATAVSSHRNRLVSLHEET
jgi:hypothetical protein